MLKDFCNLFKGKKSKSKNKVCSKKEVQHKEIKEIPTIEDFYVKDDALSKFEYVKTLNESYPYKEKRNIKEISVTHRNHPAIQIPNDAKHIVDHIKKNSNSDEEVAKGICTWANKYINYDAIHAEASRKYKKGKNKIYMNAEETFNTRSGICGETSLLVVGMAEHAGIAGTMYRPFSSHLSAIMEGSCSENDKNKTTRIDSIKKDKPCRWTCDTTFKKFEKHNEEPLTYKSSKESHYEMGVTDIANNWKYNWEKRRKTIKELSKKYNKELSTEEILDIERADLCSELKYGTAIGLEREKENKVRCTKENGEKEAERKRIEKLHGKGFMKEFMDEYYD